MHPLTNSSRPTKPRWSSSMVMNRVQTSSVEMPIDSKKLESFFPEMASRRSSMLTTWCWSASISRKIFRSASTCVACLWSCLMAAMSLSALADSMAVVPGIPQLNGRILAASPLSASIQRWSSAIQGAENAGYHLSSHFTSWLGGRETSRQSRKQP